MAEAKRSAIFVTRPSPRAVYLYKQSSSALSVLSYFELADLPM